MPYLFSACGPALGIKTRADGPGRNTHAWIVDEVVEARRNFLVQPALAGSFLVFQHAQAGTDNLAGIAVAAGIQLLLHEFLKMASKCDICHERYLSLQALCV